MTTPRCYLVLLVSAVLLWTASFAFAQGSGVLLASTTAQWWQFMLSIPTPANPLVDATGADCMVGQRNPVWFLAGTFFGGAASRTCSIPAGEALFFPVINSVQFNTPGICGQVGSMSVTEERALAAAFIDAATNLSVQLDGHPVNFVRVKSVVFATTLPADNIFNSVCGGPGTVPAGVYSPSVDDGYYAVVAPLTVGSHTLHIHAEVPSQGFVLDVTYDLTVVPVQRK